MDATDVLLLSIQLHTLTGGHVGKRVVVVAQGNLQLSASNAGNIQVDGSPGKGLIPWMMKAGDTATLLRLDDGSSLGLWREIARSVV